MDSLVTLFWINKPGKPWKVFVSNKVKKIAEITEELKIVWKYCPTKTNLLSRSSYWRTLRMTAWMLRFVSNCRIKRKTNRKIGPLNTDEILNARTRWVKRVQDGGQTVIKSPGSKLEKDPQTEILKCKGRIKNCRPIYLGGRIFVSKLIKHVHNQIMHLGVSNIMAAVCETWLIPKLREKVNKAIHKYDVCRLYSTKPFEAQVTAKMPSFRTEGSRPFEVTGLDFAGPVYYRISKNDNGKCYILIFTCAASRAIHLEVIKSQTAEEFQRKLNAFISRTSRPRFIISDNALTFN